MTSQFSFAKGDDKPGEAQAESQEAPPQEPAWTSRKQIKVYKKHNFEKRINASQTSLGNETSTLVNRLYNDQKERERKKS